MAKNTTYKTRNKYGNKQLEIDNIKFDSKLELYCYNMLKQVGLLFEFQKKTVLFEKFKYRDQAIREVALIVDFVLKHKGTTYYIDTQGFATDVSTLKYKILRFRLKEDLYTDVVWLKNQKEVQSFIRKLID